MSLPSAGRTELVGMKKIEAVKKKMDKLNKEKPGTVVLNPSVSMDKVKEFEEKYKITLPKEYVEFITLVGDGGKVQPSLSAVQLRSQPWAGMRNPAIHWRESVCSSR